jgi:hypothetical protein
MTKVLDTLLLPLFGLKHTHLYMIIHITTFHISTSKPSLTPLTPPPLAPPVACHDLCDFRIV